MTNNETGKTIGLLDHIHQSISDILTTPIGSRVMRREYGSALYQLLDASMDDVFFMKVYSSVFEALLKWEPRINPQEVRVVNVNESEVTLSVVAEIIATGKQEIFENLEFAL